MRDWYAYTTWRIKGEKSVLDTGFGPRNWDPDTFEAKRFKDVREQLVRDPNLDYRYMATFYDEPPGDAESRLDMVQRWLTDYRKDGQESLRYIRLPRERDRDPLFNFMVVDDEVVVGFYGPQDVVKVFALVLQGNIVDLFRNYYAFIVKNSMPIGLVRRQGFTTIDEIREEIGGASPDAIRSPIEGIWADRFKENGETRWALLSITKRKTGFNVRGFEFDETQRERYDWESSAVNYNEDKRELVYLFNADKALLQGGHRSLKGYTELKFQGPPGKPPNAYQGTFHDIAEHPNEKPRIGDLEGQRVPDKFAEMFHTPKERRKLLELVIRKQA